MLCEFINITCSSLGLPQHSTYQWLDVFDQSTNQLGNSQHYCNNTSASQSTHQGKLIPTTEPIMQLFVQIL